MDQPPPHTVSAFDEDLSRLRALVIESGVLARAAIVDALRALAEEQVDLAEKVIVEDRRLDGMQRDIEKQAIRVFTLRAPLADDLREVVAALKIASIVERMGDYAKNIAKRVSQIEARPLAGASAVLPLLEREAIDIIDTAFRCYAERDADLAREVCERDRLIDDLYDDLFRTLLTVMMESPQYITTCAHLLFVAKNLERIGDHATNLAELVSYAVTGEHPGERRSS